jgi:hypothetical protein
MTDKEGPLEIGRRVPIAAQPSGVPDRRLPAGRRLKSLRVVGLSKPPQTGGLRYSRLEACATRWPWLDSNRMQAAGLLAMESAKHGELFDLQRREIQLCPGEHVEVIGEDVERDVSDNFGDSRVTELRSL